MTIPANAAKEAVDGAIALAAVASPVWLPALQELSEISALILPLFGVVWLGVQIWAKLVTTMRGRSRGD